MAESAQNQSGLSESIGKYLDDLEFGHHFSPLTVRNYTLYLKRFLEFISVKIKKPEISHISRSIVENYKTNLSRMGLSTKTLGFHLIALRSFLKWKRKKGVATLNVEEVVVPKTAGSKMNFLSGSNVEKLLGSPDLGTMQGKRDRAIMELLYSTGLRVSELAALDRDNVDLIKKEIVIIKNGKRKRSMFLSLRALGWIENYLKSRKDTGNALFIHHRGVEGSDARLTVRSIQRAIVKYKKKVGITTEVTPKTLRASFAIDLLLVGADTKSVQEMLGHKNISTTQIYTHVTNKQLKDVHRAFHGKGGN
ncbi:MAG: Tyrosine recombinase XerC [Candidatus Woesebacteria bacterium GW2011_GWA2_40_7b]|uniref:Tyrosine recombinase XerC n=1 Tax=Candidatus Woesebacteria bacterium GW2011_GWA2_40_7b TaxID=1618563 RepID=A0A0G0T7X0_9BACT|nr:MAG: Tyrosine recombinase XerC [Candidatus Woesebacteria bacterium GW2011_GWA2_40_7b]